MQDSSHVPALTLDDMPVAKADMINVPLRSIRKRRPTPTPSEEPVGYNKGNNATLESCI